MDDFFARMRALAVKVDSEVEDLESKAESIRYRAGISAANGHSDRWSTDPEPSEYLVECLNEVENIKSNADRISEEARSAHETMEHFRAEIEEQFAKIMEEMRGYERYAASYGEYVPRLEVDLDYEKYLAEKRAEKEAAGDCDEAAEGEVPKETAGDVAEPTLLGCGLSKSNLSKMFGIKFMEDASERKEKATAAAIEHEDVASPQMPMIAVTAQKSAMIEQTHPSNSPFLSTDEDTSSPVPILKLASKLQDKRTEAVFTPPSLPPRAIPQAVDSTPDIAEYSRVEITPGLFVRKPSSRSNSQNKTTACASEKPPIGYSSIPDKLDINDCNEDSPKLDAQMTARVDKMLLEYKTSRSKAAAAVSDENASPNALPTGVERSETTPDMPPDWARKIAAASVKKYTKSAVSHAGDDEDIANPRLPAHPPQVAESPGSPKLSLAAQKYAASYAFNR